MMTININSLEEALGKMNTEENAESWTLRLCHDKDSCWWEAERDTQRIQRADLREIISLAQQLDGFRPIPID